MMVKIDKMVICSRPSDLISFASYDVVCVARIQILQTEFVVVDDLRRDLRGYRTLATVRHRLLENALLSLCLRQSQQTTHKHSQHLSTKLCPETLNTSQPWQGVYQSVCMSE